MTSFSIILYWYWTTNPQKIRLALEDVDTPYTLKRINLSKAEHRTEAYATLNPRMKVPTLQVGDAVLWESGAALMYLSKIFPQLWPSTAQAEGQALSLLFMESSVFQRHAGTHYWQKVIQPRLGNTPNEDKIKSAAHQIQPLLQILKTQLASSDYLFGDFSLVDCAFAPWLPHLDLSGWPLLIEWRYRLMNRASWEKAELRQTLT